MSFLAIPASVAWLQTADHNIVQWEHFLQCLVDHAEYLRASGVPEEHIQDPNRFAEPGDLQSFHNVVMWWPQDAPATHRCPTLHDLLLNLQIHGDTPRSFTHALDWHVDRVKLWLAGTRRDPENPNESKAERDARLNRERVARYRLRNATESDDPDLNALVRAAKAAVESAAQGRKWLKGVEKQAKSDCDAAIAAAKLARADTVSKAIAAVEAAEVQAHAAQSALDAYKALAK